MSTKVGNRVFCIGAGWVGILVGKDKMTGYTGLAILLSGLFLSAIGIYLEHKLSTAVTGEDL